ncbi:restriction endonuclease subunit S [Ruminococcus bromii]|nr:restriction endonuclease subunit S [Ruminococcus bromii]
MKSCYKLGELIRNVDVKNKDLHCNNLRGLSMTKEFRPSTSNIVGTDLSKYKIVAQKQFACDFMSTIRVHKMPIAFNTGKEEILVSPAYAVFEVVDEKIILPEYLMMWFSRTEFDRYADFRSDAAIRGGFGWNELCETSISIPCITDQYKIVFEYQAITERIALKQKINDNLVAVGTASIQKNVGRGALINLTEAEMDRLTLPDNFEIQTISEFCRETKSGSTPSRANNEYWKNGTISWVKSGEVHNNITLQTEEYITPLGLSESSTKLLPKDTVLMAMYGVTAGEVGYLAIEATTNQAICGMICNSKADAAYLYFSLIQSQAAISRLSNGGAQDNLSKNFIDNIKIVVPPSEFIEKLNLVAIVEQMTLNTKEIALLEELQATALAQLSNR